MICKRVEGCFKRSTTKSTEKIRLTIRYSYFYGSMKISQYICVINPVVSAVNLSVVSFVPILLVMKAEYHDLMTLLTAMLYRIFLIQCCK